MALATQILQRWLQYLGVINNFNQVTVKKYNFDTTRLFALWLLPAFFTFLIVVLLYVRFDSARRLTTVDIIAWTLVFIFSVGIFTFLFFHHLTFAKKTKLTIVDKYISIIQGDKTNSFSLNDIEEITEYSAKKLPWGFLVKWQIKTADKTILVSSLTISQSNFERHFWNKIRHKFTLLPTM